MKDRIIEYCEKTYETKPYRPWHAYPEHVVLRHEDSGKWYGLIMPVDGDKLGLYDLEYVWVLNVKCDPFLIEILVQQEGYHPAYHMNKSYWITIRLDGTVKEDDILNLLDDSFDLTMSKTKKRRDRRSGPKDWLIPANPKYYDVVGAFAKESVIDWKQGNDNIKVGDQLYYYVAAPYSAILFHCQVVETDIPYHKDFSPVNIKKLMKVKLLHTFAREELPLTKLRELDVYSVRSPRSVPDVLKAELTRLEKHM